MCMLAFADVLARLLARWTLVLHEQVQSSPRGVVETLSESD